MIDIDEINQEIERLKHGNTSYSNCERLSILYTVRDHISPPAEAPAETPRYSFAAPPELPRSEFTEIASGIPQRELISIFDDHMEALKVLYPKEYSQILRKISNVLDGNG